MHFSAMSYGSVSESPYWSTKFCVHVCRHFSGSRIHSFHPILKRVMTPLQKKKISLPPKCIVISYLCRASPEKYRELPGVFHSFGYSWFIQEIAKEKRLVLLAPMPHINFLLTILKMGVSHQSQMRREKKMSLNKSDYYYCHYRDNVLFESGKSKDWLVCYSVKTS